MVVVVEAHPVLFGNLGVLVHLLNFPQQLVLALRVEVAAGAEVLCPQIGVIVCHGLKISGVVVAAHQLNACVRQKRLCLLPGEPQAVALLRLANREPGRAEGLDVLIACLCHSLHGAQAVLHQMLLD